MTLEISIWFFLCFGVLLVHFPSLFKKHRIDEELETKMHYLEEAQKKGDFTQAEKRDQWKKFTTLIYDKIGEPQDDANQSKFDEKKEQNNAAPAK